MLDREAALFWQGLVIGFSIAAPVGPIGVLCIRYSITQGKLAGFSAGMGAASADTLYALVGAVGLSAVSGFLVEQQFYLRLAGGLFLCWLGLRILRRHPPARAVAEHPALPGISSQPVSIYASTLGLTLTNPLTILSFAAVFSGLGLQSNSGLPAAGLLVLGVFCGSAAWWLLLSSSAAALRSRLSPAVLRAVDLLSGTAILIYGAVILMSLIAVD